MSTYDSACNLASSGATCGVSELRLSGWDRLLHQVLIRRANIANAVLNAPQKVSAAAPSELFHHTLGYKLRRVTITLTNLSTQFRPTQTRNTPAGFLLSLLPLPAPKANTGPHSSRRFRENLAAADYTPHSVRKNTKPSANHVCQWRIHSYPASPLSRLVGLPPFEPSLSKGVLPSIIAANGPNGAFH